MPTTWHRTARAAKLGALCALGPSLILFGWYWAHNRHLPLPWARIGVQSAAVGMVTGAALGGTVQLLVALTERARGALRIVANPLAAGLVGGALTSVLAGIFAVAVFGANRGPYVGTVEAATLLIAACAALATLLAMDAAGTAVQPRALVVAAGRVLLAAALVAVVTLALVRVALPAVFADGVFWTARAAVLAHGPVTVGCVLGLAVGAIFGAHLGLTLWLARSARRA